MHQGETKERFLYNYIAEFMSRDLEILVAYERRLLRMEEDVSQDHTDTIQNRLMPIRRELLNLRSYYDEMMDLTKELEENEVIESFKNTFHLTFLYAGSIVFNNDFCIVIQWINI